MGIEIQWDRLTLGDLVVIEAIAKGDPRGMALLVPLLDRLVKGGVRKRPIADITAIMATLAAGLPAYLAQLRPRSDWRGAAVMTVQPPRDLN